MCVSYTSILSRGFLSNCVSALGVELLYFVIALRPIVMICKAWVVCTNISATFSFTQINVLSLCVQTPVILV